MARDGKKSHFLRVILPRIIQKGTLELPRNFVEEHGKCLSMYARLKVPTGSESKMELKRCKGRAWLDKGWRDFVDKYSIKCGYFLVFKYEGGFRFSVLIFDLSTMEINYPSSSAGTGNKKTGECEVIQVKEEDSDDEISDECPRKGSQKENVTRSMIEGRRLGAISATERAKAFDVALNAMLGVLKRPGSFMIHMGRFYLSHKPHIPTDHSRRYLKDLEHEENTIILHGSNGKTWPVKCNFHGKFSATKMARFVQGWKTFASDNHLRVGDICIFEMIFGKAKEYKIIISRVADRA